MQRKPEPPIKGSRSLGEWTLPIMRIHCDKCLAFRFFITARLVRRYGADFALPDLPIRLMGCSHTSYWDRCRARFTDAEAERRFRQFRALPSNPTLPSSPASPYSKL
jgi:hypothetical protein